MLVAKLTRTLSASFIVFSLTLASWAQEPAQKQAPPSKAAQDVDEQVSPDDVVRISTNLVQFDAVVTDKKGRAVTNLRPEDFEVKVNGKPQPITNFSYVALETDRKPEPAPATTSAVAIKARPPLPGLTPQQVGRTIALVLDNGSMSSDNFYAARRVLGKFVDEKMGPTDVAAIISTVAGVGTLQQFTADKRQLHAAIERIFYHPQRSESPVASPASATGSDDSALQAANSRREASGFCFQPTLSTLRYLARGLRDLPGRKAIVLLSDGLALFQLDADGSCTAEWQRQAREVIEESNRASAVIYTIHTRGVDPLFFTAAAPGGGGRTGAVFNAESGALAGRRKDFNFGQDGLMFLAEKTGGLAARNTNNLVEAVERANADQKGYYLIGYRPEEGTFDPQKGPKQFNSFKATLKGHGDLSVRTRNGFVGVVDKRPSPAERTPSQQLIAALQSPVGTGGVRLRLTSIFTNQPAGGSTMRSLLHVDARDLSFTHDEAGKSWTATIDLVAVTLGVDGSIADQVTKNQTIRVQDDKYQRFLQDGLVYDMELPLKYSGGYELRVAVRDMVSQKLGSAREFVQVPDLSRHQLALSGVVTSGRKLETAAASKAIDDATLSTASGPAVRRLRRGMMLDYGFVIYNATILPGQASPQLTAEIHLYRDGKEVVSGKPQPITGQQQRDLQRIASGGSLRLDEKLPSGWYSLEVVVIDKLAKKSRNTSTQWVDFEIVD